MRLEQHGDVISSLGGKRIIAVVNTERACQALAGQGHRFATEIAHGALSTPTKAKALARQVGLLAVDVGEARKKGLLL